MYLARTSLSGMFSEAPSTAFTRHWFSSMASSSTMFSLLFSSQSSTTTTTSFTSCCHFSLSLQLAPLIVTDSLVHLVVTAATTVPLIASRFSLHRHISCFPRHYCLSGSSCHCRYSYFTPHHRSSQFKWKRWIYLAHGLTHQILFSIFCCASTIHIVSDCDSPWRYAFITVWICSALLLPSHIHCASAWLLLEIHSLSYVCGLGSWLGLSQPIFKAYLHNKAH